MAKSRSNDEKRTDNNSEPGPLLGPEQSFGGKIGGVFADAGKFIGGAVSSIRDLQDKAKKTQEGFKKDLLKSFIGGS